MKGWKRFLATALTALLIFSTLANDYIIVSAEENPEVSEDAGVDGPVSDGAGETDAAESKEEALPELIEETAAEEEMTAPSEQENVEVEEAPVVSEDNEQEPEFTEALEETEGPEFVEIPETTNETTNIEETVIGDNVEVTDCEQTIEEPTEAEEAVEDDRDKKDEKKEEAAEEKEVSYPAFGQSTTINDVTISLSAAEGVLSEGAYFTAIEVTGSVVGALEDKMATNETEVTCVSAYDISLYDAEGNMMDNSWAERGKVNVSFSGSRINAISSEADTLEVVHVAGDGSVVNTKAVVDVKGTAVSEVGFDAEQFTIYAIVAISTAEYVVEKEDSLAGGEPEVAENVAEDVTYTETWTTDTNASYTVEHYKQNLEDDNYTLADIENLTGTIDTTATATAKAYDGFTYDAAISTVTGVIDEDGSLALKLYYTRNSYDVTYSYAEGTPAASALPAAISYKYEANVSVAADAILAGYTFNGWITSNVDVTDGSFKMPANDVEFVGSFAVETGTAYQVEHYKQNLENDDFTLADVEKLTGAAEVTAIAMARSYEGFTYDADASTVTDVIAEDGSIVLKLYYTRNSYKVIYSYTVGTPTAASELPVVATVKYEANVNLAADATLVGYTFDGWTTSDATVADGKFTMPANDVNIEGSFNIYAGTVTVTTTGGTYNYDGNAHGATVAITGLPEGFTPEIATSSATATHVSDGLVAADCDNLVIRNVQGDDVTKQLSIIKIPGTIAILPVDLTITTPSATKGYDGTALTAEGTVADCVSGLKGNDTVVFATTGSQTTVGSSDNTYVIDWGNSTAQESDYNLVNVTLGKLVVTESVDEIVVVTHGNIYTYDGKLHGATVEVLGVPTGYTIETAKSDALAIDVTAEDVVADCDRLVIKNAQGEDVTANFKIRRVLGSIKILPAKLSLVIPDVTKAYDAEVAVPTAIIAGLAEGETLEVTFNSSMKNVKRDAEGNAVAVPIEYELGWNSAKENNLLDTIFDVFHATISDAAKQCNYIVDARVGKILITPALLKVTTQSAVRIYNGKALTAGGEYTGLKGNDAIHFTVTGSQKKVGSSINTYEILWLDALESNYTVVEKLGTLTVNAKNEKHVDPTDTTPTSDETPDGISGDGASADGTATGTSEDGDTVNNPDVATPSDDGAGVLGAKRGIEADAGSVYGASKIGAVLGERRGAQTGDENDMARHIFLMGLSASFAAVYTIVRRKKKNEAK